LNPYFEISRFSGCTNKNSTGSLAYLRFDQALSYPNKGKRKQSAMTKGDVAVADFISDINWSDLPKSVQRKARMCLLDTLGASLAGTQTKISSIAASYAGRIWPGDAATILLHGKSASAVGAAFANGYAANGIDIDDCGQYTKGHPGAQIFAAALAVAEKAKVASTASAGGL
jgi:2-methylcitrate dehydratase PrpD